MESMTLQQYFEIVDFVQKYHKFGYVGPNAIVINGQKHCLLIKYIDSVYDSRTNDVWSVTLRGLSPKITFASNHFNGINLPPKGFKYNNLYDWVMAYLKGEWNDFKIIEDMTKSNL